MAGVAGFAPQVLDRVDGRVGRENVGGDVVGGAGGDRRGGVLHLLRVRRRGACGDGVVRGHGLHRVAVLVDDRAQLLRGVDDAHHGVGRALADDGGDGAGLHHRRGVLDPVVLLVQVRVDGVLPGPPDLVGEVGVVGADDLRDCRCLLAAPLDLHPELVAGLADHRRHEVGGRGRLALDHVDGSQRVNAGDAQGVGVLDGEQEVRGLVAVLAGEHVAPGHHFAPSGLIVDGLDGVVGGYLLLSNGESHGGGLSRWFSRAWGRTGHRRRLSLW